MAGESGTPEGKLLQMGRELLDQGLRVLRKPKPAAGRMCFKRISDTK